MFCTTWSEKIRQKYEWLIRYFNWAYKKDVTDEFKIYELSS